MIKKRRLPFQNMTFSGWQNLALAAALTFYLILIGLFLANANQINWCDNFAIDYCAFWSSGRIINERSIAEVYDLGTLNQFQKEIFPQAFSPTFEPFAIMYLPVFIIPFKFISLLQLPYSYLVWTLVNLIGFSLYLRFFTRKTTGEALSFKILLMMLLSFPVFQNLYLGQVSIWLGICAGEFMRAAFEEKPLKAGLWLGGWLLKPQLLVLILPFLLIRRKMKVLMGFLTTSFIALVTSIGLVGVDGFLNLVNTLLDAAGGGVGSNTGVMMNWRMLGWHIESLTSPTMGWIVILVGTLLTVGVTVYVFRTSSSQDPIKVAVFYLGIFAATGAVTWHAHVHMAIVLIPPMIFLLTNKRFNQYLFSVWVFVPIFVQFITIATNLFIELEPSAISTMEGLRSFILNLLILGWAVLQYNKAEEETHSQSMVLNGKELV
jgi:hypothetical protein